MKRVAKVKSGSNWWSMYYRMYWADSGELVVYRGWFPMKGSAFRILPGDVRKFRSLVQAAIDAEPGTRSRAEFRTSSPGVDMAVAVKSGDRVTLRMTYRARLGAGLAMWLSMSRSAACFLVDFIDASID